MASITEMSADARLLTEYLQKKQEGDIVTYDEISEFLGCDVRIKRHVLETARRHLLKENMVFDTVIKIGIKRLTASEIANGSGRKSISRIRRETGRGIKKLRVAAAYDLSKEDIIRMNTDASMLGAVKMFTTPASMKKLQGKIASNSGSEMPVGKTLELFK